ncbi:MAG TPA: DUF3108 domain-containing protein [Flavobacteriales bacterium]|nr:DUF3108 domain-containing protein [Flavobacteriales bacterium]
MKRYLFLFAIAGLFFLSHSKREFSWFQTEQNEYRKINNRAFKEGEHTEYLVHYGPLDAGIATLEVRKTDTKIKGRELLHIVGTGRTRGVTDVFFHIEDRYESYIDKDAVFPWLFKRDVHEGGYEIQQLYKFYQNKNIVQTQKGVDHPVPPYIQDMVSAALYARTLNLRNLKVNDTVKIKSFVDDEIFDLMIQYVGTEEIKIKCGRFRCMKFNPVIQVGRIFKSKEDLEVWISDDENKIPMLCRAKILVGSIKAELIDYRGVANPMAKIDR